jgi:hypothetical protein
MNPQNDTNRDPNSNGHLSDTSGALTQTRFVNMDSFMSFISKKTEQIATALYLVSDTIETEDPIRHRIREKAVDIVSVGKSLDLLSAVEKHFEFHELKSMLAEVSSLLSIAHIVGDISEMNKRILTSESKKLIDAIEVVLTEEREHGFGNPTLMDDATSNFILNTFTTETPAPSVPPQNTIGPISGAGEIKRSITDTKRAPVASQSNTLSDTRKTVTDITSKGHAPKPLSAERSQNDIALHHVRRQSIIKVIGQIKSASLTDIKNVIVDVGEKTLQRELMSLIAEGVVLKTGDKRWARYSLA